MIKRKVILIITAFLLITACNSENKNSKEIIASQDVNTLKGNVESGKVTYLQYCASCHGKLGQGSIGPNFTDAYWLHGSTREDLIKVITNGVPAKGMISWKEQLKSKEILNVASYILSLEGSQPSNAIAAQGKHKITGEEAVVSDQKDVVMDTSIKNIPLGGNKQSGAMLFNAVLGCAHCHGANAKGHKDNRNIRNMTLRYGNKASNVFDLVIQEGRNGTAMPPWNHLTDTQKKDVKTFIFSIQTKNK